MLVWGAWREAMDRALAAHRLALGHHRALIGASSVAGPGPEAGRRFAPEADPHLAPAAAATAAAARLLTGGWLGAPWLHLAAHPTPLGRETAAGPTAVRLGATLRSAPLLVPILTAGHLVISAPVQDPTTVALVQNVLLRLLAASPAGELTVIGHDPTGLGQVFAPFGPVIDVGLMHEPGAGRAGLLAALDAAEARVRRTWQSAGRPSSPSGDRGAEPDPADGPRLVLALAGLGVDPGPDVLARLTALAHAGPDTGVSLLIAGWPEVRSGSIAPPPALNAAVTVTRQGHQWWVAIPDPDGGPVRELPLTPDEAAPAPLVRTVTGPLAEAFAEADRVRFGDLLAGPDQTLSSATGLATPIGRVGRDPLLVRFDDATPHWLVGGRSGAGKTVFLLDVLAGLATRYPPQELALYLLDFKEGVSFTEFTPTPADPTWIPQAVAVGVESDREYGIAVLTALRAVMTRRANEFKQAGVTNLGDLRRARPELVAPRVLAVIDEFQVLFAGNDHLARQATELLEDLARKGRSYGVHLVLSSQTTAGIEALATKNEAIFGQFPMRIALAGGSGVLDTLNSAADALAVGSAVINPSGGIPEANTVVRIPLADPAELAALRRRLWEARPEDSRPPAVFAGYAAQHVADDPTYAGLTPATRRRSLLLGRRIEVGSPTASVSLDATPGRHLAVLGPSGTGADLLHAAVAGLARQHAPQDARFLIACLVPAAEPAAEATLVALADAGHTAREISPEEYPAAVTELARFPGTSPQRPTYLVVFGADAAGPGLAAIDPVTFTSGVDTLRTLVQTGPTHGVHLLGWWRSLARFAADLGHSAREDVACLAVLNLPAGELQSFLGQYDLSWDARPNRALVLDRHEGSARVIVPFVLPDRDPQEWS